jgi:hypothetical protein
MSISFAIRQLKNNVLIQTLYDPKHILFVTALEEGKNRHLK